MLKRITAQELIAWQEASRAFVLLDVRDQDEYAAGHIPGSVNIPVREIADELDRLPEDMQTPVVVYCQSGIRARRACVLLDQVGYADLYELGGISVWPGVLER